MNKAVCSRDMKRVWRAREWISWVFAWSSVMLLLSDCRDDRSLDGMRVATKDLALEAKSVAATQVEADPDAGARTEAAWYAAGREGAVSTAKEAASKAAIDILKTGGNAADAAAAALLALAVADHEKFHFGGEVVILVYDAREKSVEVLSGQGAAPALATRERFAKTGIPSSGILAATVPGAPDAIVTLLERHGSKTFKEVVQPTLELLKNGRENWHWKLAKTLRMLIKAEEESKGARRLGLLHVADAFYRGDIARKIAEWSEKNGGLLRYTDLAVHRTWVEAPAMVKYHGFHVYKPGPWTQGPVLLQALGMLDYFKFSTTDKDLPRPIHLAIEALKLAFADRDAYFADPRFVDSPVEKFVYPYYLSLRRKLIDVERAALDVWPGDPWEKKERVVHVPGWLKQLKATGKSNDTSTCVVVDKAGNMVAATPSGWSGVEAGGDTGVWLGSRLQSFNTWIGHPNVLAPGKRPRTTLTPTIVLDEESRPVMAMSVAGGDQQDQVSLQMLMGALDFKLSADAIVTRPRYATEHFIGSFGQTPPRKGVVKVDAALAETMGEALRALGHVIEINEGPIAEPSVVTVDWRRGILRAAGDPRTGRSAMAY